MIEIKKLLNRNFIIFDIGSSFAKESKIIKKFSSEITYVEIDAISLSKIENQVLHKNIQIKKGIHTESGTKDFIERKYIETSSFLDILPNMEKTYGMEYHFMTKQIHKMECTTVNEIMTENNLTQIDFLKTDIEGLDFEIIKSIENRLDKVNVIKSEVRFQPFYVSEPPFYEVCQYLADRGFEFINFSVLDEWKPKTTHQKKFRDGRLVMADFVFFRILNQSSPSYISDLTKQIIIAKSLNLNSYSEFLLESNKSSFETSLFNELKSEIDTQHLFESVLNFIFCQISKTKLIHPIRKTLKYLYQRSRINDFFPQGL